MHCCLLLLFLIANLKEGRSKDNNAIDLSWPFDENTIFWSNSRPFNFTKKIAEIRNGGWYAANDYCAGEHGGTHFDAPYHFSSLGWKIGDIPLSRLIVTGVKVDLSEEVNMLQDEARLLPKHLELWEESYGSIPNNSVVLVCFGWSQYYSNRTKYLGIDEKNNFNFPGISAEAAEWIVKSNKIVGVGVDTASVDAGMNIIVHQLFGRNQIYGLENVNIPNELPDSNFDLYVMPMKIKEGTGAPARIFAIPHEHLMESQRIISGAAYKILWHLHIIVIITNIVLFIW